MKLLMLYFMVFLSGVLSAQTSSGLSVSFIPTFLHAPLTINPDNQSAHKDTPHIETLKSYISNVELSDGDKIVFAEQNSYHLLNMEDPGSLSFHLHVPDTISFSHIKFNIGIDSSTNASGVFGGDLDPTNGMYWTWQSGYINFKLEGIAEESPARHHRFQFHIGGYQSPFNALQSVVLKIVDKRNTRIEVNLDQIFRKINLAETYQIMSPNQQSVEFSQLITTAFSILP